MVQGTSAQSPQSLKSFLFTEQSNKGQTFVGMCSNAQKVCPFTAWQPWHWFPKNSQSVQINPQAESVIWDIFM
jgi:hypothetical protein